MIFLELIAGKEMETKPYVILRLVVSGLKEWAMDGVNKIGIMAWTVILFKLKLAVLEDLIVLGLMMVGVKKMEKELIGVIIKEDGAILLLLLQNHVGIMMIMKLLAMRQMDVIGVEVIVKKKDAGIMKEIKHYVMVKMIVIGNMMNGTMMAKRATARRSKMIPVFDI